VADVSAVRSEQRSSGPIQDLNGRFHRAALWVFMAIVIAHWVEHVLQAIQVYALGWERPDARGALGLAFPWLVRSESLHYVYAIVMLVLLIVLRPGFTGRSRTWWDVALAIQFWHHIEHAVLLAQVVVGANLLGREAPMSFVQLAMPMWRIELHLFYNAVVFIPMVIAMILHTHPTEPELGVVTCTCAAESRHRLVDART
jgi:hypothetical protein